MTARVVLGVSGGIAAYKSCELLRRFTESGHDVTVVPTASALEFVGAPTWAALSGKPVATDVWTGVHAVPHVHIGQQADVVVVAPATADLLARAAHGLADDLLTNTLLTARCPVVFAPAMHTEMWEHPATQANVATLRQRGAVVIEPAVGRLTGADTGKGRLPEPGPIFELVREVLDRGADAPQDLAGRKVVVSAGGTREYLDPVRFLGNRSSGLQGYALARAAAARGAHVTLVSANVSLVDPAGASVVRVETTAQLREAVVAATATADAVVMAAAPADFRPTSTSEAKIKKADDGSAPAIALEQNPDILAEISHDRAREDAVIVGFAAETGDATGSVLDLGRAKLARKGCDLLVVNDVSGGAVFGSADNEAVVLGSDGAAVEVPRGTKTALAHVIWDEVVRRFAD
ncbi:bifunctional phosphopantothenoylcysteine decarboxylase/phosphopantothenate--cysteine ligase CoaBC [Nocardioides sp. zg-1228]|uniref:bifunctional phosphopantothenoylcysteine decarboxylase/phosphopantothenate--cysteine ligase CoaBC n=1 Tax=Nocardioides sp. zg-1228 TaxID=2763008 RepID=UPI0016436509|nr:bifunctional phosphopantothenoylcysteine decarboxylase/phosphopantothenate--cysteine ligase CoaBC [Nocardioides sp. zg-1228]MBC2934549.1 bifunctional phosphopantothenoylcysteine decarboxylase/phosphopantothenate--cysteine ligase CoaBC [Nocardioides sp. zg-1228]QSF59304.1 bifunctional phosphopantothenoylcysteine decarboxylase/phosphopantothenate--cysteine ligase CoaBC [Nocardioides sp. zg-1228]